MSASEAWEARQQAAMFRQRSGNDDVERSRGEPEGSGHVHYSHAHPRLPRVGAREGADKPRRRQPYRHKRHLAPVFGHRTRR